MKKLKEIKFDWGKGLFVAITLFIIATLSVVGFIITIDFDLVSQDYYEKGVQYEHQIKSIEQAAALGESVKIEFSSKENAVEIIFPEEIIGQQLSGTITFYRPSNSSLDRIYTLQLDEDYTQNIDAQELTRGKWLIKLAWANNEGNYFTETSIFM